MDEDGNDVGGVSEERRMGIEFGGSAHDKTLHKRTGEVTDSRRLVMFIYLVLRDMLPACYVAAAHNHAVSIPFAVGPYPLEVNAAYMRLVGMLVDQPTNRVCTFVERVRIACRSALQSPDSTRVFDALVGQLSPADDVECFYSNGFLASYAKLIADELTTDVTTTP